MSTPIILFFHALTHLGMPPRIQPQAVDIIREQMNAWKSSGLDAAADEIHIGINGGAESLKVAEPLFPKKSKIRCFGLQSRAENLTLVAMHHWARTHNPEAYMCYGHVKAATHLPNTDYFGLATRWRRCMTHHTVENWKQCVADLDSGLEAVGAHWLSGMGHDHSQSYFAGNFYWVRSSFLATIPSMFTRDRIKESGISSAESRYEAEVILGNGPRLPRVKSYAGDHAPGGCP